MVRCGGHHLEWGCHYALKQVGNHDRGVSCVGRHFDVFASRYS